MAMVTVDAQGAGTVEQLVALPLTEDGRLARGRLLAAVTWRRDQAADTTELAVLGDVWAVR
jgi:hypothetical protein